MQVPLTPCLPRGLVVRVNPMSYAPKRDRGTFEGDFVAPSLHERMRRVRHEDTEPELNVRRILTRLGLRYRVAVRGLPGTPDIVNRIQQETAKALNVPSVKERLLSQGAIPSGNSPAEFAKLIDEEIKKWAQVVKVSGAKVD